MTRNTPPRPLSSTERPPVVLVVDDEKDLADTYAAWLADDCEVRTAYSGIEAREHFDDDPDVVLLDRRMPGVPGDRVLEEIRDQIRDCQVAMLTAVDPDRDIVDLPFDACLVKPVTHTEVRETVNELLLRAGADENADDSGRDREPGIERADGGERIREAERIQALNQQLTRLKRISSVIRDVDQQLVTATSREEIERTVCERLIEADPYEMAWIGDYTPSFDEVSLREVAVAPDVEASQERVATDGGTRARSIVGDAIESGEAKVVTDLQDGSPLTPPGQGDFASADRDIHAGAVVPITYRDVVYGALTVYTSERGVLAEKEVAVLAELGDTVANAINSVESKKLMLSDTVVELEFAIRDRNDVFVSLSAETGARIDLNGFVPAGNGALTSYIEVTGTTTETFLDAATEVDEIESVREINDAGEKHLYECRVADSTVVLSLVEAGANVETMNIDRGRGEVAVNVAPETDVRTVFEAVRSSFPDAELVAKRETERSIQSTDDFRKSLTNKLTDRQYAVLKAAYSAGYFDWPRGSTAKEIAESLDLAPPTLHEHLRGAQNELVETFFRETGEFGDDRLE